MHTVNAAPPRRTGPFRLPPLAAAAWAFAAVVAVGLAVGVWHYLAASPSASMGGMGGMPGMGDSMSTGDALTRGGGSPLGPLLGANLITSWQLDAIAVAVLVLAAAAYLTAVAFVPVRATGSRWPVGRTASFLAGLAVCAFATNGSIAVYDQVLFTAHMVGHLLLVMVGPALIVAGQPLRLALAAAPPERRERLARQATGRIVSLLTAPPVALACYTAVIVGSHLTGLMDVIMRNTWAGQLEHLVYVLAGCQFFVLVIGDEPIRWRLASPARWLLLAVAMAVDTFTGVVLLQGTRVVGMVADPRLSVDRFSDTRTGGAIMWVGGDAIMAVVMIGLVVGWLRTADDVRRTAASGAGPGWLEQVRVANFAAHTSGPAADVETFDEDDAARASYNEWLARLDRSG